MLPPAGPTLLPLAEVERAVPLPDEGRGATPLPPAERGGPTPLPPADGEWAVPPPDEGRGASLLPVAVGGSGRMGTALPSCSMARWMSASVAAVTVGTGQPARSCSSTAKWTPASAAAVTISSTAGPDSKGGSRPTPTCFSLL